MKEFLRKIFYAGDDALVARIAAVFLLVNLMFPHTGGDNADSRFAMIMGMVENQTFAIDGYEGMTGDWSQTPDGHYYSNKPPGPALLAYPVAWVLDRLVIDHNATSDEQRQQREKKSTLTLQVSSWVLQLIPAVFLMVYFDRFMRRRGLSTQARAFGLIALAFGTTPSMMQNSFFGHGMAATATFAALLLALDAKTAWSAMAFGVALLADYGAAFVLPGLIWLWLKYAKNFRQGVFNVVAGAFIPGLLWIWYHTVCFGSPFFTAHRFLNPIWVDVPAEDNALWGIFRIIPNFDVLLRLLFGAERGILFTQPWILAGLTLTAIYTKRWWKKSPWLRDYLIVATSFFVAILLANASFNGWHGGETIGPRYLSVALYCLPLLGAIIFDEGSPTARTFLNAALMFTCFYFCFAFCQSITEGMNPWGSLTESFMKRSLWMKFRVLIGCALVMTAVWRALRPLYQLRSAA